MAKGLLCFVYINKRCGDSTNGGISSKYAELVLTDGNTDNMVEGCFSPDVDNVIYLYHRKHYNDFIAAPKDYGQNGPHYMFGGNFLYSSDSRFPLAHPVKIFDRQE